MDAKCLLSPDDNTSSQPETSYSQLWDALERGKSVNLNPTDLCFQSTIFFSQLHGDIIDTWNDIKLNVMI